jgi:glycosyltransferase involved in cell wall biosynthesis
MWKKCLDKIRIRRIRRLPSERVKIVVATKNSARWFGAMIDAYRERGIEPLVLLDGYSTDGTEPLLIGKGIKYAKVFPELPRVEAMIGLIPNHTDAEWVLRLDDDEFPSLALIAWISDHLPDVEANIVGMPRRWVRLGKSGRCEYSNHVLLKWYEQRMDIQWRLFKPHKVEYKTDIHSPGFLVPKSPVAPDPAYLVHFDWIVRSWKARAKKLEDYDKQKSGAGSGFRDLYLWESADLNAHAFKPMETTEFDPLARLIRHRDDAGDQCAFV